MRRTMGAGMGDCHRPKASAARDALMMTSRHPAAMLHQGMRLPSTLMLRQCGTGQAPTHSRQPWHSGEATRKLLSTGRATGQALVQRPQDTQVSASRVNTVGESQDTRPRSAP